MPSVYAQGKKGTPRPKATPRQKTGPLAPKSSGIDPVVFGAANKLAAMFDLPQLPSFLRAKPTKGWKPPGTQGPAAAAAPASFAPGSPIGVIAANAKRLGLDPAAVLAYALEESSAKWGAVGDRGYSFGPFQAHGQSPWGPGAAGSRTREQARAWATSPQGLVQMMGMMARAGAKGLTGPEAVRAIYTGFGRGTPAAIPKGLARYQEAQGMLQGPSGGATPPVTSGKRVKGEILLPTHFKSTHDTDGIDGYQPSVDITAVNGQAVRPWMPVGAPEDGIVFRHGSAQGGDSLYFRGRSGRVYWIGHIFRALPVGTRVTRGSVIARVADQHVSVPHVHIGILRG